MDTKPQDQTPTTETSTPGQVMDIAAPKTVTVTDGDAPAETQSAGSVIEPQKNADVTSDPIVTDSAPAEEPKEAPAETPAEPAPEAAPEPAADAAPAAETSASDAPAADAPAPTDNPMAIPPTPSKHHTPVLAIVVAVIVALGLAGAVVFMYMSKNKKPADTASKTGQSTVAQKPAVSAADVDTASSDIDKNLSTIDDTKDFVPTDLSDASLGLQ